MSQAWVALPDYDTICCCSACHVASNTEAGTIAQDADEG